MIVAFHTNTLFFRGSEAALWDYAVLNESVLGNRSVLCFRESPELATSPVAARWRSRFPVLVYRSRRHLAGQLQEAGASALYMIKPGPWDGMVVGGVRNCVHAMYLTEEFHGDSFAFVSRWMSRAATGREDSNRGAGLRAARCRGQLQFALCPESGVGPCPAAPAGPFRLS